MKENKVTIKHGGGDVPDYIKFFFADVSGYISSWLTD